jgi:hypothetical protein
MSSNRIAIAYQRQLLTWVARSPGKTPGHEASGRLAAAADEIGEWCNRRLSDDADPVAEEVPECDAGLGAGVQQAEACITAVAAYRTVGAAADLALHPLAADAAFRTVAVQRNLRPVERHQQFALVGVQPLKQTIEGEEAGAAAKDAIKADAHLAAAPGRRLSVERLEIDVDIGRGGPQNVVRNAEEPA